MSHFCPSTASVSPVPHTCPSPSSVPFTSGSPGSLFNLIQVAPHNTLHGRQSHSDSRLLCSFLCICHFYFRRSLFLFSVCISYSKLNPQLKWKSSQHPSGLRAITSCSWRCSCHFCCSSENLITVLPFSLRFCHKH